MFCPALGHHINPDGSAGAPSEPIAADFRNNKEGRLPAFLKIVAGILGVDFDSLYQREKRCKRKRALALAAAAATVVLPRTKPLRLSVNSRCCSSLTVCG
jgi:hypothetical protein